MIINKVVEIWTLDEDFSLMYNPDSELYYLDVETIYYWKNTKESIDYLNNLLQKFTEWMTTTKNELNYLPTMHDFFQERQHMTFTSISQAYFFFKLYVEAFTKNPNITGNEY